jgi:hypothetical protein
MGNFELILSTASSMPVRCGSNCCKRVVECGASREQIAATPIEN